jgi:fibronectin-binding autotransporter adhesin
MRTHPVSTRRSVNSPRPLTCSLAQFKSIAAACAALLAAGQATHAAVTWDGNAAPTPGDGFLWTNPLNWSGDALPDSSLDGDVIFANPAATVGVIQLNGNQTVSSIYFTTNDTLGAYGTTNTLTNSFGTVTVDPGVRAVINADFAGTNALNLSGGGSLLLNNFVNSFTGPINIDGAGTRLTFRGQGILPYINNNNHVFVGRSDAYSLGFQVLKTVTLTNGGELRLVGTGYNPDGPTKNIVLGGGEGAINVAAGWQQYTIDDAAQIGGAGSLTKNGNGRLLLLTQAYNLTGDLNVNAGVMEFGTVANSALQMTVNGALVNVSRFNGFTGSSQLLGTANNITVNGGFLMPNNGTVSMIDAPTITLNGGALTVQGADHEYGVRGQVAGGPDFTTLVLNGGSILSRDAYNPLQTRSPRINSLISGSGTINLIGATNANTIGNQGHVVFQRSDVAHTFNGTLVLRDYATLENRANQGTAAASINVGKTIGNATLELAGVNTMLDMRDNGPGSNGVLAAYATNNINVTATQAGNLQRLSVIRSTGANTGNTFQFGTLTIGSQRLQVITDASAYNARVASMSLTGTPFLDLATNLQVDGAVTETGAGGQGIIKHLGNSNLTFTGSVNASSVDIRHGNVILSGAAGAINPGSISGVGSIIVNGTALVSTNTGGAGTGQLNGGVLLLDNTTVTNANRLNDAVPITMLGSSTLQLTSQGGTNVSETTGNVSVPFGNPTFNVVRTGAAELPALTLGTAALSRGANAVLNFTGTSLGTGATAAQIILPAPLNVVTPFLGGWATSGNEFAKYDAFGVTPLVAGDYSAVAAEGGLVTGLNGKVTTAPLAVAPITLTINRAINSLNFQTTVAASTTLTNVNTNGNTLTIESGGILGSGSSTLITGTAAGGLTAGTTAAPAQLFVTTNGLTYSMWVNSQITDNLAGGAVTLVKSGTGIVNLTNRGVPPTVGAPGYTNTFTGGVVVNNGILITSRGTYLGAPTNPITLAGGQLEVNMPSLTLHGVLPGFGHNITVTANSFLAVDDNGATGGGGQEASDATSADNNLVPWGSLTINGGHTLSITGFGQYDQSFTSSNFAGSPTINTATGRDANSHVVIGGVMTGSGFNLIASGTNAGSLILGAGAADATSSAGLSSPIVIFGTSLRLNKANGNNAVGDLGAGEDVIVNGGTLAWGPGHIGNIAADNSNQIGLANLSPAAARLAGQDQIADTATITLLSGTIGETDKIQNDVIGTLNMKSGTLNTGNSGEGKLEFGVGNISGGTVNFNWATHLKFGTLNLLPGAPALGVANGLITRKAVIEIGAGGLNFNGSRIELQSGGLNNFAGGGAVLRLGGNVTASTDPLNGTSLAGQGIFATTGANMREISNSYIDLMGGVRDFNIADGIVFGVSALMTNGGYSKSGPGIMDVQQYTSRAFDATLFDGPVSVSGGILIVRSAPALGTALGGVTINGGTLKVDGSFVTGDTFSITGGGANVTGTTDVQELGAIVLEQGQFTITGPVSLGGNATLAPSVNALPGIAAAPIERSLLTLTNAGGITGTGTLTLSGNGDGSIAGGIHTLAGGLNKDGGGRWEIMGGSTPGTFVGPTVVSAGVLRIGNGNALGSPAAGTTVYAGASLELIGGITVPEPLTLSGDGIGVRSGALVNVSGNNTVTGAITLLGATLRSNSGLLTLGAVTGGATSLTLAGAGNGRVSGILSIGPAPAGDVLTKTGSGTWTLFSNNALSGSTAVNGGTLVLASSGQALDGGSPLNLGGGSVTVTGGAQVVNGLNLVSGGGTVNGGARFSVSAINRSAGTSVNFAGTVVTSTPNTAGGILGGYATVGSDWATAPAGTIVALPAGSYVPAAIAAAATDNALTSLMLPYGLPSGTTTLNTLKISGGSGMDLLASSLALTDGGVIYSSAVPGAIAGTGLLSGATGADDLIVHVTGATLDIAVPIIGGTGGLVKTGSGTLVLSGTSNFTGSIDVNGGTLQIVNAPGFPGTLGAGAASGRLLNLNGGTFSILNDWDINDFNGAAGNQSIQVNIGSGGGTLKALFGSTLNINDGAATTTSPEQQLRGSGDLTFTGGGRLLLSGGTPQFLNFTGNVNVDAGILTVGHPNSLGGRQTQTVTLAPGSVLISNAGANGNMLGLPNNIVANSASLFSLGGDRVLVGDINFTGTNTIGLIERDTVSQNRSLTLAGRLTGSGTINVFGHNQGAAVGAQGNGNFVFLNNSSNTFTGTYNLKPNAGMEARQPGSLGSTAGGVTVTMDTNSRLLLRGPASGDFMANVVVNGDATINADRMAAGAQLGSGDRTQLTINNLTVNNSRILSTISGANNYAIRVDGTASFTGDANLLTESNNLVLSNGASFSAAGSALNKYGSFGLFLLDASNHTGATVINNGSINLRGTAGALSATGRIELRGPGATLFVDNGDGVNANRINNAADLVLGGGALRVQGTETVLANNVTAPGGHTTVDYNNGSVFVTTPLALGNTFARSIGATINFTSDNGTLGVVNAGQFRAQPAITIPFQADLPAGDIIPWAVGTNNEFVRYDSLLGGVVQMNNNQSGNNTALATYLNDAGGAGTDATWLVGNLIRPTGTTTTTFTASRTVKAVKLDGGAPAANTQFRRVDLAGFTATIDRGLINQVGQTHQISNSNAAPATLTTGNPTGELFLGVQAGTMEIGPGSANGTAAGLTGSVVIANNGTTPLSLVKFGAGTVDLRNTANANTFTGGVYVNQGTLRTLRGANLGPNTNTITMNGGTLEIHSDESGGTANDNIAGLGHNVVVNGNALLGADNGLTGLATNVDDNLNMGTLTINGSYVLQIGGFDGFDWNFTGASFTGTPIIDIGLGRTSASADLSTTTISGVVSGSGFRVIAGNTTAASIGTLQLAGAAPNTYAGEVTVYDGTMQLNKVAGNDAITGSLTINGGTVALLAADQINNASNVVVNRGTLNLGGFAETVNTITMNGGFITTGASALNVTNDVTLRGTNNVDGLQISSGATVGIGGTLRILDFGKASLGGAGATVTTLTVNGLELEGSTLRMNADAAVTGNQLILLGNVTTLPSAVTASVGNVEGQVDDLETAILLNGSRTFNVANGPAANDLLLKASIRNNGATMGSFVKNGGGTVLLQGGANANTYSGPTLVNDGVLVLHKSAGGNALGDGSATNTLTIGDVPLGGPAKTAQVIVRNSEQIANTTDVTLNSDGLLDLDTFNTSETIGNLTGAVGSAITLGPTSTLTVTSTATTTFSGSIAGGGLLVKEGAGTLSLDGSSDLNIWTIVVNGGTLNVDSDVNNAVVIVSDNTIVNLGVSQKMTDLIIGDGAVVTLESSPGPLPGPLAGGDLDSQAAGDALAGSVPVQAVPEPGTAALLLGGMLTMLGIRRRRA